MSDLSIFGFLGTTLAITFYLLEGFSAWFILAFAAANVLGCIYAFLQGAWLFLIVEIFWSIAALGVWSSRTKTKVLESGKNDSIVRRAYTHGRRPLCSRAWPGAAGNIRRIGNPPHVRARRCGQSADVSRAFGAPDTRYSG
jgi:hypothetical protein